LLEDDNFRTQTATRPTAFVIASFGFNVFVNVKNCVELKTDSKDDEDAVAEDVADLLRIDALNHDADAHHHAREAQK